MDKVDKSPVQIHYMSLQDRNEYVSDFYVLAVDFPRPIYIFTRV